MKDIFNEFLESYMTTVVPRNASEVQKSETRLAFLAGAFAVLKMIKAMAAAMPEGDAANEEMAKMLGEFEAWLSSEAMKNLKNGKKEH